MEKRQDLIVPVYLNQTTVFDLLAMLQGGIATVTRVAEAQKASATAGTEASGVFGLGQALASLMRIELTGKAHAAVEGAGERSRSEERIHTPASLLFTLRSIMAEES